MRGRARVAALVVLTASACDVVPADAPPDASLPPFDAATACARAPLGELTGFALMRHGMGPSSSTVRADVRWVLAASEGCVDRYRPTGPGLRPGDGSLVLDRTRPLVTYEMRGGAARGQWANASGTFDGHVISGGYDQRDGGAALWELVSADANFPAEEPGCVEPPLDHLWGTGLVSTGAGATITWTRASTAGCVDRFTPSGVAIAPTRSAGCVTVVTTPPSAPIQSGDGELVLDRTRRPLRVELRGATWWPGARLCTQPDGTMYLEHGGMGGPWAGAPDGPFKAAYDGTTFLGATRHLDVDYAWSLTRLQPAAASSPER